MRSGSWFSFGTDATVYWRKCLGAHQCYDKNTHSHNNNFTKGTHLGYYYLYQFPVAAVTVYQKLSGLKQHKFIILWFATLASWHCSHLSLFFRGESLNFILPFPISRSHSLLDLWPTPSSRPAVGSRVCLSFPHSDTDSSASGFHFSGHLWLYWVHLDNPGFSSILSSAD